MYRRCLFGAFIVASAALGLVLAADEAGGRASQKRQQQRFSGSGVRLDDFNLDLSASYKGAPGKASGRTFIKLDAWAASTERCAGFPLEAAVLGGSVVEVFADFSKLIGEIDSGYICIRLDGFVDGRLEGSWVGGVQRYADASGTFSIEYQGVSIDDIAPPKGISASGSISGTIVVGP
jgi:hypothetical protein